MQTCVVLALMAIFSAVNPVSAEEQFKKDAVPTALQFKMKSIEGKEVDLAQYQGRVVLVVNVASQ